MNEGYRAWDVPVAMPDMGEVKSMIDNSKDLTLEDYFAGLNKLYENTGKDVQDHQVGGVHYQQGIQPWDIFLSWGLDPWTANVVKYILRFPHKNEVEDLEKAKHYIEYLIQNYDKIKNKYYERN